jgi:purine-binding chemotaxis protein CheW
MAKNLQIVVFGIGQELYGVGIEAVHEIVKVPEITAVPDAPAFLEGMINLRGRILPVINLRRRLRLPAAARGKATRVLITESGGRTVGLLVDSVSEVLKVPSESLEPPPEIIVSVGVEYIAGVVKQAEKLVTILDFAKIFNIEELRNSLAATDPAAASQAA